jgi:hypothetical protein
MINYYYYGYYYYYYYYYCCYYCYYYRYYYYYYMIIFMTEGSMLGAYSSLPFLSFEASSALQPSWQALHSAKEADSTEYESDVVGAWKNAFAKQRSDTPAQENHVRFAPTDSNVSSPVSSADVNQAAAFGVRNLVSSISVIDRGREDKSAEGLKLHARIPCCSVRLSADLVKNLDAYAPFLHQSFSSIEDTLDEMARACANICRFSLVYNQV